MRYLNRLYIGATMILFALIILIGHFHNADAETLTVAEDGSEEYTRIQDAINASENGDTVRVLEGTYHENVIVNKSVMVVGDGSEVTVIHGSNEGDVIIITAEDTASVMESVEQALGMTKFNQEKKLPRLAEIMNQQIDLKALSKGLGLAV